MQAFLRDTNGGEQKRRVSNQSEQRNSLLEFSLMRGLSSRPRRKASRKKWAHFEEIPPARSGKFILDFSGGFLMIHMFKFTSAVWFGAPAVVYGPSGVRLFIRALINRIG